MRYLVDTNVFLYARGKDHPYREPCRELLRGVHTGAVQLDASAEVVQEFLHVLLRRGIDRTDAMTEVVLVRRQCRVHAFDNQVLDLALGLLRRHGQLGVRDAVHASTAIAVGIPRILSTDRVFDSLQDEDVERVDPLDAARLLH